MSDAPPPGPTTAPDPILAAPRKHTSRNVVAVIVVSFVAFAVMIAIVVNAMLNTQQQQVKNLFQNVQYCVDHPRISPATSACAVPVALSTAPGSEEVDHATRAPGSFVRARR